ncbi:MAG: hypothetical protein AVDCRST_MAG24-670 [uncultured Nocardioidaceae bacterium]|uniref:Uncharacterized protein n=1 Tax=uncultured Nocardioidaceae bacterium TaxID=253824 RepID=A0A6J4LA13_9ACTN|nr:MAG: hypothetical protein AVDCRST_MAG24-670 [uncultured Nocardioidaceae bacterium]
MTTRLTLRTALRSRLEDTTATPLWDDASLNEALAGAMGRYGARVPIERRLDVAIPAATTTIAVATSLSTRQVVRVLDARGEPVARAWGQAPRGGDGQAWRWWGGSLVLALPLGSAQMWTIEYLGPRPLPADDVTAVEIEPGDEELVVGLAASSALTRRAVEDAKRGLNSQPVAMVAAVVEADAAERLRVRTRRATGGWLTG